MGKRPAGLKLMEDAKDGKFDVVIFYRLDRLARSLRYFLDIVDFFDEVQIGLRSMTETFDTTNPMGRFAIQTINSLPFPLIVGAYPGVRAARSGGWS